jgi:2-aminoadipate transaminase
MISETTDATKFDSLFADRMADIPRSFLREILSVATQPGMISFAGGLPNKELFPVAELQAATEKTFRLNAGEALQYSGSPGLPELREAIAARYKKRGIQNVDAKNILITCGSQQALDLLAKILVNEGDPVVLEDPSYLGGIQALAIYRPRFLTVPFLEDGLDTKKLDAVLTAHPVKLMYLIPTFQNPTGLTYTDNNRRQVAEIVRKTNTFLIEDDPYGEIRFEGSPATSFMNLIPEQTILLGTFSKTLAPGFRLGWVVVPEGLMEKLLVAKQATDLHSSTFTQYIALHYLNDNDPDAHIAKIVARYAAQKQAMLEAIGRHFPKNIHATNPQGGMFLWATMPQGASAMQLFEEAAQQKVCIVPGHPFTLGRDDITTMRLSFSCVDAPVIEEGIQRLGAAAYKILGTKA